MNPLSSDVVAELRLQLHDFMLGFARMDATGMARLDRPDWALAARIEQLRRHPLVSTLDDEVLAAIASHALDPNVEGRYLMARLRESEEEARLEARAETSACMPAAAAPAAIDAPRRVDLPPTVIDMMEETVALIARKQLGFLVLHARNSDRLDFRDCSVWSVRDALIEAYEEGWHAAA
ncbi:DUF6900 domain-containing protein [Roseateles asaccharophilus]|uniref:DUF6900 domain-containing protein n=1 Tax=Roseateles asaccharophilus TaxID=582607 RepID=A0ABU2AF49_9BURK|nr:hypothetical protein [Roseateles asaccharophilus]MDR7335844.1 hypothetical protein [Roseateles asaccharophilus]